MRRARWPLRGVLVVGALLAPGLPAPALHAEETPPETAIERAVRRGADHLTKVLAARERLDTQSPARPIDPYVVSDDQARLVAVLALRACDRELPVRVQQDLATRIGQVAARTDSDDLTWAAALALLVPSDDAMRQAHLPALRARLLRGRVAGGLWGSSVRAGRAHIENPAMTLWALLALHAGAPDVLAEVGPRVRERLLQFQGETGAWSAVEWPVTASAAQLAGIRRLRPGDDEDVWRTITCSAVLVAARPTPGWPDDLRVPLRRIGARALRELRGDGGAPVTVFKPRRWTYEGLVAWALASRAAGLPRSRWYDPFAARLVALQRSDGAWGPVARGACARGDATCTALALLFLAGADSLLPPPR